MPQFRASLIKAPAIAAAALLIGCDAGGPLPDNRYGGGPVENGLLNAQEGGEPPATVAGCGAPLDTNGNGRIEAPEWMSFRGFAFDNWNKDRDTNLTPAEFHACWRSFGWGDDQPVFQRFDADGNGLLSKEEFFGREAFQRWDSDGDSELGQGEWPPTDANRG